MPPIQYQKKKTPHGRIRLEKTTQKTEDRFKTQKHKTDKKILKTL